MYSHVHTGEIGIIFKSQVVDQDNNVVNIGSGYTLSMVFRKPDTTYLTVTPILTTDGSDGLMSYTTKGGDINLPGAWQRQGVASGSTAYWTTDITQFQVLANV